MVDGVNRKDDELAIEDKIVEVMQIIETLDYPELLRLCDLIDEEYKQKAEAAREAVIAETQRKFQQLGLSFEEVVESQTNRKRKRGIRAPAPPKYRSPDGLKSWTGRGVVPKWIREIEEGGGSREDCRIKAEE
jgi:DNA-binding protein H-NS